MSAPDKRRPGGHHGGGSGHGHASVSSVSGSATHVVRTVSNPPANPLSATSSSSLSSSASKPSTSSPQPAANRSSQTSTGPSSASTAVIAPPPRAALHSTAPAGDTSKPSSAPSAQPASAQHGQKEFTSNAAAAAAATHRVDKEAIRSRDERIASLERELVVMETEFQRELERASAQESETASFWQAKYSAIHTAYLRADTELRLLRAEVDVREAERGELREGWEVLRREAQEREEVIRELRGQVRGLKEWVSNSARGDGGAAAVSDEVFAEGMGRLANGLQNWVIVHFRRAKIDLTKTAEAVLEEVRRLVPMYDDLVHTAKVHLLQSVVSSILVEQIFDAYFVGLTDEQEGRFKQTEEMLENFGGPEQVNNWRSQTFSILRRGAESSTALSTSTSSIVSDTISRINNALDGLTGATRTDTRDTALRVLINNSIELSRMLSAQRAVFRVEMPKIVRHQRLVFDPGEMEDIGGEDEEELVDREIACATFPAVVKLGDENGGGTERYRNVIAKARVLCAQNG